ncbi:MAG: Wzt carbohydrate-binding domain-containing protein, partial [Acidimicrobiales bacterium]
ELLGPDGRPTRHLNGGDRATVRATIAFDRVVCAPNLGVGVVTESGAPAYSDSDRTVLAGPVAAGSEVTITMSFRAALVTGSYTLALGLWEGDLAQVGASAPVPFFVSSRPAADGVADLEGRFGIER